MSQPHSASDSENEDTTPSNTRASGKKQLNISSEIAENRKSFWQRQEEEERERLAEEKRRAAEKQAQFEKERKLLEEFEARKLAETIRERDRLIEASKNAEKGGRSISSSSQPSSIVSSSNATTANGDDDDDGRVGRRSELLRLERNLETQSLISKGLIKNKRAIFEQAQQQQQQAQSKQPTLSRRSSGAVVTQRMNAFKSLDNSTSTAPGVNDSSTITNRNTIKKLADNFVEQVSVGGDEMKVTASPVTTIKKETEPIVLKKEVDDHPAPEPDSSIISDASEKKVDESSVLNTSSDVQSSTPQENGSKTDISQDENGNTENSFSVKSEAEATNPEVISNEELILNGKNSSIKAIALFDYQAADNTEISFDPDDKIGHIQKVDPGWWHGQVMTGRFKGQAGLFPANYVQELDT